MTTLIIIATCLFAGTIEGKRRQARQLNRSPVDHIDDCPTVYADGEPANDTSDCDHDFNRGELAHCKHCGLPWNGGARSI